MPYPTLEEAKKMADGYRLLPVAFEMLSDTLTPINIFRALEAENETCFLLESAQSADQWGRYSFIGVSPKLELTISNKTATITEGDSVKELPAPDPVTLIRELMQNYKSPKIKGLPKFTGGFAGYFAYDTMRYYEAKLNHPPKDDLGMPDCHLLLASELIAFDHLRHKSVIIINIAADGDLEAGYAYAKKRAGEISAKIRAFDGRETAAVRRAEPIVRENITREAFIEKVNRAKEYIVEGDIFQVVLSRRIEIENPPEPFDTYRVLRASNPSPYMYYFKLKDCRIVGSSPEMLVSVTDGEVFNRPIAGTIRRGRNEKEDKELENMLLSDKKEQAEHTMLVDLGRNDVGKVSRFGSVEVTRFMAVEKYSQVMHLVTDVKGALREDKDSLDALMAVLPAGTLSGAPKVRAMEIIDELETCRRGLYGGTVGYIGFDGDMDTCIAIRTVLYRGEKAYIQTGAGIVYDSVAESEFEETENKAKAMVKAIVEAGEIL